MKQAVQWVLAVGLVLSGCIEDPTPKRARIVINGESGKTVRVIMASEFVAAVNEQGQTRVVIFSADTTMATLPFERTVSIERSQQFFAETSRAASDVANLRMQVFIDNNVRFDEGGLLRDRPFRYVYTFNRPLTQDITVVL